MPDSPEGPDSQPTQPDEHDEGGIELARSIARGLAGRTGMIRRKPGDSGGSGSSAGWNTGWKNGRRRRDAKPSGAHPDERDPQPLEANLERMIAERGWSTEIRVHGVFSRWGAIVGREVADHVTPESYADGHLVVRTDSTAWATQMKLLAPAVVRRLNEELGEETVRLIDIEGPRGPSWRKGRLRVKGRGPRDTYG